MQCMLYRLAKDLKRREVNRSGLIGGCLFESRRHVGLLRHGVVAFLSFGRRDVADGLQQPAIVEPVHPLQGRKLDGLERAPWSASMDDLGLVETVDRFGEGVVVRVAHAAHGGLDARLGQALGVSNADVLAASIAVVHEPAAMDRGRRSCRACSRASRTKLACAVRLTRQPTILRAKVSMTKATENEAPAGPGGLG